MLLLLLQTSDTLDQIKNQFGLMAYIVSLLVVAIIIYLVRDNNNLKKEIREKEEYYRKRDDDELRALMDLTSIINTLSDDIKSQPKVFNNRIDELKRDIHNLELRINERINLLKK